MKLDYNIVLIGFMGTGKTTVSEYLNQRYDMDVVDMDTEISKREGMGIPEIFEVFGEVYFRDLETALLKELQSRKNTVISCGGGAPMREENVKKMKKNGRVVLLTARPETIYGRVKDNDERPVLKGKKTVAQILELMTERQEKYRKAADLTVSTDGKSVDEICEDIIARLTEGERDV